MNKHTDPTYCGVKCKLCFGGPPDTSTPPYTPPRSNMTKTAKTTEEMRAMSETGGALESLGTTNIPETAGRDAIHIAVIRRVAETRLFPGQHVGVDGNPSGENTVGIVDPYLGNVVMPGEPFWLLLYPRTITGLRHVWSHPDFDAEVQAYETASTPDVSKAELEEAFNRARTEAFNTLKNDPEFISTVLRDHAPPKVVTWRDRAMQFPESAAAVRSIVESAGVTFAAFMDFMDSGKDYMHDDYDHGFNWDGDYITVYNSDAGSEIPDDIWPHLEKLTGRSFPRRATYFSCSR